VQLAVSEFDEKYGDKIVAQSVDATAPDAAAICESLGFQNHGLVIRDGAGKTLWSQPDHSVIIDEVQAKLDSLLE